MYLLFIGYYYYLDYISNLEKISKFCVFKCQTTALLRASGSTQGG